MEHPFAAKASDGDKPRRRDYEKVLERLESRWRRRAANRARMMQEIIDALWAAFGAQTYSWCGFYSPGTGEQELTLGPHRDKPGCSPIGLQGVCGKALLTKTTQVVPDVQALGKDYIACDPETRSEIVVPVADAQGTVFTVLDIDSKTAGAFNDEDRRWLERILKNLAQTPSPEQSR